jgi:uncharacterized protein YcfJ
MKYFFIILSLISFALPAFSQDDSIKIISRTPRYVTVETPVCTRQDVLHEKRNTNILGAIAGGILGNQIGGGNGKTIATALGAVIGSNVATNNKQHYITEETVCVYEKRQVQQGEIVTFMYKGKTSVQIFD